MVDGQTHLPPPEKKKSKVKVYSYKDLFNIQKGSKVWDCVETIH